MFFYISIVDLDYFLEMYKQGRLFYYASFEFNDDGNIFVKDVLKGSVFYRAGIRKNDIINSINGKKISSFVDLMNMSENISDLDSIKINININRNHKNITVN